MDAKEVVERKNTLAGNPDGAVPASMNYERYEDRIICEWGVELLGWTEGEIVNPRLISTTLALRRLLIAIERNDCHWTILSPEELAERCEQRDQRIQKGTTKERKKRCDAGVSKKVAGKKRSLSEVEDDSTSED
ncbi:hypothetical protein HWV62_28240 [Athelia sp. TMB]|nr:hypothetical protein HWV62_28240 [Athelia sp. TMB]